MSGLLREDRLAPVVTDLFYYGTGMGGPWIFFDMLDIPEEYEDMKPFMSNYKVNWCRLRMWRRIISGRI